MSISSNIFSKIIQDFFCNFYKIFFNFSKRTYNFFKNLCKVFFKFFYILTNFFYNIHTNLLYFLQKFVIIFSTDSSKSFQNFYRYLLYFSRTNFSIKFSQKRFTKTFLSLTTIFLRFLRYHSKKNLKLF